jgi:hypothetical protein
MIEFIFHRWFYKPVRPLVCLFALWNFSSVPFACATPAKNFSTGVIALSATLPSTLSAAAFIQMAKESPCHQIKNRLFIIDNKVVFWDRAGRCPDNAHEQTLFAHSPDAVLATSYDSIAGPRKTVNDEKYRLMYDTILAHLDEPDLGLGSKHKVKALSF